MPYVGTAKVAFAGDRAGIGTGPGSYGAVGISRFATLGSGPIGFGLAA